MGLDISWVMRLQTTGVLQAASVWIGLFLFYFGGNREEVRRHKAVFVSNRYPGAKEGRANIY